MIADKSDSVLSRLCSFYTDTPIFGSVDVLKEGCCFLTLSNLITTLIRWALIIGMAGGLVDTTIALRNHAKDATRIGLVSLVRLNNHLSGNSHK